MARPAGDEMAPPTAAERREAAERAEQSRRAVVTHEAEVRRASVGTASAPARVDQALSAVERQITHAERAIAREQSRFVVWFRALATSWRALRKRRRSARAASAARKARRGGGVLAWYRRLARSWRRSRARKQSARIVRMLERAGRAEQTSSALLAIVTERVARLGTSEVSADELAETIEQAERIAAEYDGHIVELDHKLEDERAQTLDWIAKTATATNAGAADLAARARARVEAHERLVRELELASDDYNAGRRRLRDAIDQLRALAQRSARAPASPRDRRGQSDS